MGKLCKKQRREKDNVSAMNDDDVVYFNSGAIKQTVITESFYEPIPKSVLKTYLPKAIWQGWN